MKTAIYYGKMPLQMKKVISDKKMAEVLLHYGLKKQFQMEMLNEEKAYGSHGKPFLKNREDIFYNKSHSGEYVICAISDQEIGIDIEHTKPRKIEKMVRRVLNAQEYEKYKAVLDPEAYFYEMWVLKESYLKYTGEGITVDMKNLPLNDWYQYLTIHKDYRCCIYAKEALEITLEELSFQEMLKIYEEIEEKMQEE